MASLSFRRAYHQSVPQAIRVDDHHFGPLPLYVELSDFLMHGDFVGAQLLPNESKPVVAVKLSRDAQTKFNQIALENSGAQKLEDYVGLFLYFNGVRSDHMMMAFSQLQGDECWINGLSESEANSIVNSLSPRPKL